VVALPAGEVLRAAAMGEPTHERGVAPGDLHAVDAEIELLVGPLGNDQRPGDEGGGFAGPTHLDGQLAEVDVIAGPHHVLARGMGGGGRSHRHDGLDHRQHRDGFAPTARRFGLAQEGQRFANGAEVFGLAPDAGGDAGNGAE